MTKHLQDFGFFDEGRGEPVILLHSSLSSRRQWRKLQSQLGDRYRLLGLDLLGYGETPMPAETSDFTFAPEVDLVERLMERVEGPVHLAGHSYGGAVALKTALRHPSRVRSVYAHEPVLFALLKCEGCLAESDEIANLSRDTVRRLEQGQPDAAAEGFIDYWSGPGTWRRIPQDRKLDLLKVIPKIRLDFAAILNDGGGLAEYKKLTMPVMLTAGDTGAQPGRRVAELLAGALPNGSLQILEGGGHMAPVVGAERVNAIIDGHLHAHSAAQTE